MVFPGDILGAKASNAGDEFHEIWALRKALSLLDQNSDLTALKIEGVAVPEGRRQDDRVWDGVDCSLYYGGSDIEGADRIDLVQLKYSVSAPKKNWTLGRLTKSKSGTTNNSVARRLGNAFKDAAKGKSRLFIENQISVSLISNQPISSDLSDLIDKIIKGSSSQPTKKLKAATGLSAGRFILFCKCLQLKGGEAARTVLKSNVIEYIASVTDADVSSTLPDLRQTIRARMLPDGSRDAITRQTVITWFNVGDPLGLFPCEARFEKTLTPIPRKVSLELVEALKSNQIVALGGGGGCGKTTIAMELGHSLPEGSQTVIFDCYGAGSYLDRSLPRHRPEDAFTQLSNDLAIKMRVPFLIPHKENPNLAASFRRRLKLASDLLRVEAPDGLFVVIVDAADNAVSAANDITPPDRCFVHELVRFLDLPANVRLIVTTRSSRLKTLQLPSECPTIKCDLFELEETKLMIHRVWPQATSEQIKQFHYLSNRVPRVQAIAVARVDSLAAAIEFLRPNGQTLNDLFAAILKVSAHRLGGDDVLDRFCGALSILSTPIPPIFLANLCGESEAFVHDVRNDLSPNVRLTSKGFEFANEDFEFFIRQKGKTAAASQMSDAADLLLKHRHSSEYAAIHLFDVLAKANRQERLFEILEEDDSTRAIIDKVIRRRTDLGRLKIAVSIASVAGDAVQAGKTILIGAEAVQADSKVSELIHNNIPLSAAFAETTVRHEILRDADQKQFHGPLQMYLAKETALRPETLPLSREYFNYAIEWINERTRKNKDDDHHNWDMCDIDLIALAFARYKDQGWDGAITFCRNWTPDTLPITLFTGLVELVLKRDGLQTIRDLRSHLSPKMRWVSTIHLMRAGKAISKKDLIEELDALCRSSLPGLNWDGKYQPDEPRVFEMINNLLFFLDICRQQACSKTKIIRLLNTSWPEVNRSRYQSSHSNTTAIDFTMRVEMALSELHNRPFDAKMAFRIKDDYEDDEKGRRDQKSDNDFLEQINALKNFYEITNDLITLSDASWVLAGLKQAAENLDRNSWRYNNRYEFGQLQDLTYRRIVDIHALHDLPAQKTIIVLKSVFPIHYQIGSSLRQSFNLLLCHKNAFDAVSQTLSEYAEIAVSDTGPASNRADVLIEICNLLLPVSPDDAKVYFEKACEVVQEMDVEAIDQTHFLTRASTKFAHSERRSRKLCVELACVVEHAARILDGERNFPFGDVIRSMASLSTPIALCAVSRWTDTGLLHSEMDTKKLFKTSVTSGNIDPVTMTAMSYMIDDRGLALLPIILSATKSQSKASQAVILNELAERAALENRPEFIVSLGQQLQEFANSPTLNSPELDRLNLLIDFLKNNEPDIQEKTNSSGPSNNRSSDDYTDEEIKPDYTKIVSTSARAILDAVKHQRASGIYRDADLFLALKESTLPADRTRHLEALCECARSEDWPDRYIEQVIARLDDWNSPATKQWAHSNLPKLIVDLGGWVMGSGWNEKSYLESLIDKTGMDDAGKVKLILNTIEENSANLGPRTLYQYAAKFIQVLPLNEAEDLFRWYLSRRSAAQNARTTGGFNVEPIELNSVPENVSDSLPLFLYRYLGDIDARVRWRTAHAIRSSVKLGQTDILSQLLDCANIEADFSFTSDDIPFHHLTAKLWLAISLARIANDTPSLIAKNAARVLNIATSGPPHLLIEHYIKRALLTASESEMLRGVTEEDVRKLASPAAGTIEVEDGYENSGIGHQTSQDDLRFRFDSMDTLPYWYDDAVKIFADVEGKEFLKIADHWIVDKWGAGEETANWDKEPRRSRMDSRDYPQYSKSHGSYPVMERYSTYLEWHAMFVAAGDLMQSRKIAKFENDDYYGLGAWLQRWDTTYANFWLSDLCARKPAKLKYWHRLSGDDDWLENIGNSTFYDEICVEETNDIVLASDREVKNLSYGTKECSESVRVIAALVSPDTATGLLRALQTTEDPWDYYLPIEPEIHPNQSAIIDGFSLLPAVRNAMQHTDRGFDEMDPVSFGSSGIRAAPADKIIEQLNLEMSENVPVQWSVKNSSHPIAQYHSWSELADGTSDQELRSIVGRYSNGHILSFDRKALLNVMLTLEMDMIFNVEIQRIRGDHYARSEQKDAKECLFARIYILRRDGSFEDIDRRIGSG